MKIYKIETTIALGDNENEQMINTLDLDFQTTILNKLIHGKKLINCNSTCTLEKIINVSEQTQEDWIEESCKILGIEVKSNDWVEDDGSDLSIDIYSTCISPMHHKLGTDLKVFVWQPGFTKFDKSPRLEFLRDDSKNRFVISLDEDENKIKYLKGNYKKFINDTELEILIKNIKKYRIAFLNMWRDKLMSTLQLERAIKQIDKGKNIRLLNKKILEKRYGKY